MTSFKAHPGRPAQRVPEDMTGEQARDLAEWCDTSYSMDDHGSLSVLTRAGMHRVEGGDWIIKVDGDCVVAREIPPPADIEQGTVRMDASSARAVFRVLVEECGAGVSDEHEFVRLAAGEVAEFHFSGTDSTDWTYRWGNGRVACLPGDATPARDHVASRTNARLSRLSSARAR